MADRAARLAELAPWVERARSSTGWDFSWLALRHLDPGPPWNYESAARDAARFARAVLDLGTGGGERFARIAAGSSARCVATEEWPINATVAGRRLQPLGISVVAAESARLPLRDNTFDLVLSRHEAIEPAEIARVLAHGGRFLTQQVENDSWPELRIAFPSMADFGDHGSRYSAELRRLGFNVTLQRHSERVRYPSLGAFVFMVAVGPWTLPEFELERDLDAWLELEAACSDGDGVVVRERHYLLEAVRADR